MKRFLSHAAELFTSRGADNADLIAASDPGVYYLPDFEKLADAVEKRLKGACIGYSVIISHKDKYKTQRSGGQCRQAQDAPARNMTMVDKYSIASVSKTITAAALLKALSTKPGGIAGQIDQPVYPYLPSHWTFGMNFKTITFRELLTHHSGLRSAQGQGNKCDYQSLKSLVSAGVILGNKLIGSYNNRNYALMRLLIPALMGYAITPAVPNHPVIALSTYESIQAVEYANGYKDYCHKSVLDHLENAFGSVDCVNSQPNPGLYYAFPKGADAGIGIGDLTLYAGGQGWVMSTLEMADFFRRLHYTTLILPKAVSDQMKDELLGYDYKDVTKDGVSYFWKNGIYNNATETSGYRSLIIGFGDGVQMAIMANSIINLQDLAVAAHEEWHA